MRKESKDVRDSLEAISKHMEEMLKENKEIDLSDLDIE